MESQIIYDSAPDFNSDSEVDLSPSPLIPVKDLFQAVVNTPEKSKNHVLE